MGFPLHGSIKVFSFCQFLSFLQTQLAFLEILHCEGLSCMLSTPGHWAPYASTNPSSTSHRDESVTHPDNSFQEDESNSSQIKSIPINSLLIFKISEFVVTSISYIIPKHCVPLFLIRNVETF